MDVIPNDDECRREPKGLETMQAVHDVVPRTTATTTKTTNIPVPAAPAVSDAGWQKDHPQLGRIRRSLARRTLPELTAFVRLLREKLVQQSKKESETKSSTNDPTSTHSANEKNGREIAIETKGPGHHDQQLSHDVGHDSPNKVDANQQNQKRKRKASASQRTVGSKKARPEPDKVSSSTSTPTRANTKKSNKETRRNQSTKENKEDSVVSEFETHDGLIRKPHPHDILLGRGKRVDRHIGNIIFRGLCWSYRHDYAKAARDEKRSIASMVWDQLRFLDPPARILERDADAKPEGAEFVDHEDEDGLSTSSSQSSWRWRVVSEKKALDKICNTLRERRCSPPAIDLEGEHQIQKIMKSRNEGGEKLHTVDISKENNGSSKKQRWNVSVKGQTVVFNSGQGKGSQQKPHQQNSGDKCRSQTQDKAAIKGLPSFEEVGQGTKLSVFWPLDDVYYDAQVITRIKDFVFLEYIDDQEREWLDLHKHKFRIAS